MPKSLTEVLKRDLSKHGIELLDIYVFEKKDLLRVLDKKTNRVVLYLLPKKLSSITSIDDIKNLGSEIVKNVQKS